MLQEFPRGYFDHNRDYPQVPARKREEFPPPDLDHCHKYYTSILTLEGTSVTDTVVVPLQFRARGGGGSRSAGGTSALDATNTTAAPKEAFLEGESHEEEEDDDDDDDYDDDDGMMEEEDLDDFDHFQEDNMILERIPNDNTNNHHHMGDSTIISPTPATTTTTATTGRITLPTATSPPSSSRTSTLYNSPPISDKHAHRNLSPANYAYWLQRELREAIYGSVWQGQILERIPSNDGSLRWKATAQKVAVKIMDFQKVMEQDSHSAERPLQEIAAMQHLQRFIAQEQFGMSGGEEDYDASGESSVMENVQEQRRKREMAIQGMMEHHVMTSLDVLSDDTELYLVMPFCNGGELFDVLEERKSFPESEARFWMKQILRGIETLQKAGMCHRDMSLENILTTSDNLALIIDFGMSIRIPYVNTGGDGLRQRCLIKPDRPCGKPYYCSPEIVRSKEPFDGHAVDIWALGPLLFLMVCGFPPWENATPADERFSAFSNGQFAAIARHWNLGLSPDLEDLLQRLFWINPRDRLSLEQVKNHPWMSGRETRPPQCER